MKFYHLCKNRWTAGMLAAALMVTALPGTAWADTNGSIVEITDAGPLMTADTPVSQAANAGSVQIAAMPGSTAGTTVMSTVPGSSVTETTAAVPGSTMQTTETTAAGTQISSSGPTGTATDTSTAQSSTTPTTNASSAVTAVVPSIGTGSTGTSQTGSYFQPAQVSTFLRTAMTATPEVNAEFAILVDADANLVVADKNGTKKMYPASMTKVMTLLVACEHITNFEDQVEITQDIVDYVEKNGASNCGFKAGEKVSVKDLLYGLILPSGADAALALVRYIAGSEEQFVSLMNQKAQQLGISQTTHFMNTTGLYDENHYSTAQDLAIIMQAASQNTLAATILTTRNYVTQANNKRSSGISMKNLFLTRIDTQSTGGQVNYAKTGYIEKAGNCAVSYFTAASGKHYICVTGKTSGAWNVVYAHTALYKKYAK